MSDSKVYMFPDSGTCNGSNLSASDVMALTNGNNNGNMMWNNPWIYMVWMMMFRNGFWGNNGEGSGQINEVSRQVATLADNVNTNHNNDLAMAAITGNGKALAELAGNLNVGVATLGNAITNIRSSIDNVAAQTGLGAERVINSVLLGNKDIIQQMCSCCCENKQLVTQMGYEGQLRDQTNTCAITTRIGELANGIQTGFAQVGYNQATNTNSIIQSGTANTQRIIDTLNAHWQADLQQRYADAKLELSQQSQNAYLISQLKTT